MKTYAYSGYTAEGGKAKGLIEALNLKAARERLLSQGVYAKQISDVDLEHHTLGQKKIKPANRAQIYRELSTLLHAGSTLDHSIGLLQETIEFQSVSMALAKLRDELRGGNSFSSVFPAVSTQWKEYERALLEVGEATGTLSRSMNTLADFLEDEETLREETRTALLYPLLILFFSLIIVGICSFWLLPMFQRTLIEAGLDLPVWTGFLIGLGKVLSLGWLILIPTAWLLGRYAKRLSTKDHVTSAVERRLSRIPGLRTYMQATCTYRFCRTYTALLEGGVLLVDAFPLAARACGSAWVRLSAERLFEALQKGESLAGVLNRLPWVSHSLSGWIRAGEESGAVAEMLNQAGERAKRQSARMRERALKLLEPLMIVLIGMFILGLSLAVLGPIMSLNESLMQ